MLQSVTKRLNTLCVCAAVCKFEKAVDVTNARAVTELIENCSVDFLDYMTWDEVLYDLDLTVKRISK